MQSLYLLFLSTLYLLVSNGYCGKCPPNTIWESHCSCSNNLISCGGNLNLKQIFHNMSLHLSESDKHFESGFLGGGTVELEDNTFEDITFKNFTLRDGTYLKKFSASAFEPYNTKTIEYYFDLGHITFTYMPELDATIFFDALSSLVNLREVEFSTFGLQSIPEHAFKPINGIQKNFVRISFNQVRGNMGRASVKSIGRYAFFHLNNLQEIDLYQNSVDYIAKYAFSFYQKSNSLLFINLIYNNLNSSSIQSGAFDDIKRPTQIDLRFNKIDSLNENVFRPFLRSDRRNRLYLEGNPLKCDERMGWLKVNEWDDEYHANREQIIGAICTNGESFFQHF